MWQKLVATSNDLSLTILRLVLGIVFFFHGTQKMLGWFGGFGFSGTMHMFTGYLHVPAFFAFLAIAAEFFGSIGLILGFLSRIAAFGVMINMLVAVSLIHRHFGIFMNWTGTQKGEGYEFHLLVIAICIVIIARGAGALSVDRALTK